jgi:hypothetical protein
VRIQSAARNVAAHRVSSFPVLLSGTGFIPPANAVNYVPWTIVRSISSWLACLGSRVLQVGYIFQYVIRRRATSWWQKYNYVLSAALDSGVAISTLLIFFWYGHVFHGRDEPGN